MESLEHIKTISIRDKSEIDSILTTCKNNVDLRIALFCKESDIAVLVMDLLQQLDLEFDVYGVENRFFKSGPCKDILSFLTLALYPQNIDAFKRICYKSKLFLKKEIIGEIIHYCNTKSKSIYDILQNEQLQFNRWQIENIRRFLSVMKVVAESKTSTDALEIVFNQIYGEYFYEQQYRHSIIDVLKLLAEKEPDIEKFIWHISELENEYVDYETDENIKNITITSINKYEDIIYDVAYIIDI